MKITDMNKTVADTNKTFVVPKKAEQAINGRAFHARLTQINEQSYQQHILDLKDKIIEQGEVLKGKADINELKKYRALIAELINETASRSFSCKKSNAFDSHGRRRSFVIIRNINEKLNHITEAVLADQTDQIKLVDMVDGIRGLVVDLSL